MHAAESSSNAIPTSANSSKEGAGILIRTLKEGTGTYRPQTGDTVTVRYRGFLEDGTTPLEATVTPPIEFQVGARQVMEGWDVAVRHLVQGQCVEVTIPHLYAYGEQGYPPKIPPRSTLVYRMELLNIEHS